MRIDDELDADALQFGVAGHEVLARWRGYRQRRLAAAGRHGLAHLCLRLWRVEEEDISARGDKGLQPRQGLVEAARGARVGAGQQ